MTEHGEPESAIPIPRAHWGTYRATNTSAALILTGLLLSCAAFGGTVGPCPIGTAADYVALGSTGCTPGADVVFRDFTFSEVTQGGLPTLRSTDVSARPVSIAGGLTLFGVIFNFGTGIVISSGQSVTLNLGYTLDTASRIDRFRQDDFHLSVKDATGLAFAGSTVVETCPGFPVSGCPQTPTISLSNFLLTALSFSDSGGPNLIGFMEIFTSRPAGPGSSISIDSFEADAGVVSEPHGIVLCTTGLLLLTLFVRRFGSRQS